MKYTESETVKQIVDDLREFLSDYDNYDKLVEDLDKGTGVIKVLGHKYSYSINGFWDGDAKEFYGIDGSDGFDLDFGFMGFTIYRDGKSGIRLCKNATYYEYESGQDFMGITDIEL